MGTWTTRVPWLVTAFAAAFAAVAIAGSETPPEGPPWTRELAAAQTQAIRGARPVFAYFTKTY